MTYKITQGKDSYYEVSLSISEKERDTLKKKVLKSFQKDVSIPGFRKGHAPLDMVESQVKSSYVLMGMLEQVIHTSMQKVLEEHTDKQFVGQPYDVNPLQLNNLTDKGEYEIRFKVDVYPQAEEQDAKWKKKKMNTINFSVTQEKKDSVLHTIQKQFASYSQADTVSEETVAKIRLTYMKDGNELSAKTVFIGDTEYKDAPLTDAVFTGLAADEVKEVSYKEDTLPAYVHYTESEQPDVVRMEVQDIKKTELPELTDEFVVANLGQDGSITSVEDLQEKIEITLQENQLKDSLQKHIDEYIATVQESFSIAMPSTFVQEELKHRVKSMTDQLGGEEGFKAFFDRMGEEKARTYMDEMKEQASASLRKFFLMKHLVDVFDLTVDWNIPLDAEKKLYMHLTGEELSGTISRDNSQEKDSTHTKTKNSSTKKSEKNSEKQGDKKKESRTTKKSTETTKKDKQSKKKT